MIYHVRGAARWLRREIAILDPGYFALVMATGIISNAFYLQGQRILSDALFAANLVAYLCLLLFTLLRLSGFRSAFWAEFANPRRVFLFFTFVAATDVLGIAIGFRGFATFALVMWLFALGLWSALIYFAFAVLAFLNTTDRANIVEGAWLNAIVATQSLVILGTASALPVAHGATAVVVLLYTLWTIGLFLYGIFVVLLCYRMFFSALAPQDVTPPLWIVMGAAAISANAGSLLIGSGAPFLHAVEPFLYGVTLSLWAWATWWIPLLLLLGIWKHGIHRVPINYTPTLWSIVFPLGMYGVATLRLSRFTDAPGFGTWSWVMIWIALAAWSATSVGLVRASAARRLPRSMSGRRLSQVHRSQQ